jgi:hypothetical protein
LCAVLGRECVVVSSIDRVELDDRTHFEHVTSKKNYGLVLRRIVVSTFMVPVHSLAVMILLSQENEYPARTSNTRTIHRVLHFFKEIFLDL